jgi:hypothetical protein
LAAGPCATISPKSVVDTHVNSTVTMQAQVTSCSQLTQIIMVNFDGNTPGYPGQPAGTHYWEGNTFTCSPPNFSLSPGASTGVSCQVAAQAPAGWSDSGQGTATATELAASGDTVLDSELYSWAFAVPAAPGGGSGNQCNRTSCIF